MVNEKFPSMKAKKMRKLLRKLGYRSTRQAGSHAHLECEGRPPITWAFHDTVELGPTMVKRVLVQQAGLTLEEAREACNG